MSAISNPHPTGFAPDYDPVPSNNTQPPPDGAPEGWKGGEVNNTVRQLMAAVRQNYDYLDALNQALTALATQEPGAVAITGGTVAASTLTGTIAAGRLSGTYPDATAGDANMFGGATPQHWYDRVFNVGCVIIRIANDDPPFVPSGISATWEKLASGRFLKTVTTGPGGTGGNGSVSVPNHNHSGDTGAHALTQSELPRITGEIPFRRMDQVGGGSTDISATPSGVFSNGAFTGGSLTELQPSGDAGPARPIIFDVGSDSSHRHTIPNDGGHVVSIDPPHIEVIMWRRTA